MLIVTIAALRLVVSECRAAAFRIWGFWDAGLLGGFGV